MPLTIQIKSTGLISYRFPAPTTSKPGAAFKSFSPGVTSFYPVPIFSIQKFKRIYALEGEAPNEITNNAIEREGLFLPAKSTGGYRVIEKQDYTLGLSLSASVGLVTGWMGVGLSSGVSPSFGKGYLANRFAPSLDAIDSIPKPEVPTTLEQVKKWNPGDSLSTSTSKSLAFNTGFSVLQGVAASASVVGTISTSWNVGLSKPKKGSDSVVKLVWAKDKGAKFSLNAGNLFSKINLSKAWGKSESFSYQFDLSSKARFDIPVESYFKSKTPQTETFKNMSILEAYQEALNGNLVLADAFSQKKDSGVKKISEDEKKSEGTSVGGQISFPYLMSASVNIGKKFIGGRTKLFGDDHLLEELLASYSHESGTEGILSNDMKRLSVFAGNFQQISPLGELNGELKRRYSASYKYYYAKNNVSSETVEEELRKLRYKVGFMKELKEINIPKGNIGSLEMELSLTLSNYATDELMKLVETYPEEALVNESVEYIDGFFKGVTDAKQEICESYRVRILDECIFTTKRQTKSAMKSAISALREMKKYRMDMDFKNFVKAYADFGKGFIENRFTMKTFLRMLRNEFNPNIKGEGKFGKEKVITVDGKPSKVPYEITLNIKGTNIAPVEKILYTYK